MQCSEAEEKAERKGAQVPALNAKEVRFGVYNSRQKAYFGKEVWGVIAIERLDRSGEEGPERERLQKQN